MRRFTKKSQRFAWTLCGALGIASLGCAAGGGTDGSDADADGTGAGGGNDGGTGSTGNSGGSEGTGSTGGTGSAPGGGAGGNGAGGAVVVPPDECAVSTPGARLLRRLTRRELLNTHDDVFGSVAASAELSLPGDSVDRVRLSNDASILTMSQDAAQALLDRAEEIAGAVTEAAALASSLPCSSAAADAACATEFIQDYGAALFRRPLEQADTDRYLGLFQDVSAQSDFNMGLKWTLVALMQSPHAVYRSELGEGGQLTPYEIASELSYNYSASPPSAELLAAALSGELDDPDRRFQEAKALLATPRGQEVIRQFFEEWLNYRDVLTVSRDTTEDFETVRPKMARETELFINALLFDKEGKLPELLTADFTIADTDLSNYYGFPGGTGDVLSGGGTEVPREWGLGIFAQGSVTATMASIKVTSPTRRGLLLLRRLYCEVPGAPAAINFDLTADSIVGNTTRERLENSHLGGTCANCHAAFDPLGFGFEHIDNVGRYRTEEATPDGNFPIDATATVALLDDLPIDGQEELMLGLSTSSRVLTCVSDTFARYVYGGGGSCRAPDAQARVMASETSMVDFLAELAREPHFVRR